VSQPLADYLATSLLIDYDHPIVAAKAAELRGEDGNITEIARRCYYFVRDEIAHSRDIGSDVVTLTASEVLRERTGRCFAKSHLLAALLRANKIPAALCYQRLRKDEDTFTLHGLNAVYLPEHGWYRCDARGNKPGIHADFTPPVEQLAWSVFEPGEFDLNGRHAEPLSAVVQCLSTSGSCQQVYDNLPDVPAG